MIWVRIQALSAGLRYGTRNFLQKQDLTINASSRTVHWIIRLKERLIARICPGQSTSMWIISARSKPQQEWSISTLYSRTGLTNNFNTDLLSQSGAVSWKVEK